jgi:hypothetical protein
MSIHATSFGDQTRMTPKAAISLILVAALVSALSVPDPDAVAFAAGLGMVDGLARLAVHIAPVLAFAIVLTLTPQRQIKSPTLRFVMLGIAGGICGFVFGLCLNAFAGLQPFLQAWIGDMRPLTPLEAFGAGLGGMFIVLGLMFTLMPILRGVNIGKSAPKPAGEDDYATLDHRESRLLIGAVPAWIAQGALLLFLALLNAASLTPQSAAIPSVLAALVILSGIIAWSTIHTVMRLDEFERSSQKKLYSATIIIGFVVTGLLVGVGSIGLIPELDAYGVFVVWNAIYILTAITMTSLQAIRDQTQQKRRVSAEVA